MKTVLLTISNSEAIKVKKFIEDKFASGEVTPIEGTNSLFKINGVLPLTKQEFDLGTKYKITSELNNLPIWYLPEYRLINTVKPYTEEEIAAFEAEKAK